MFSLCLRGFFQGCLASTHSKSHYCHYIQNRGWYSEDGKAMMEATSQAGLGILRPLPTCPLAQKVNCLQAVKQYLQHAHNSSHSHYECPRVIKQKLTFASSRPAIHS